jgi:glycine hydroxymethyltransferase
MDAVHERVAVTPPEAIAQRIRAVVEESELERARSLNLNPSEGVMSPAARTLLASDLATRVSEGLPGVRDSASNSLVIGELIDELEATLVALVRRMFGVQYVEWRPFSSTMANAVVLFGLAEPGDVLLAQSLWSGGNVSYHTQAVAGLRGLKVEDIPGTEDFDIDLDAFAERVHRHRPRCVIVGGSKVLFPYAMRDLRAIVDEVGAYLIFDAAHVGPFIAAGDWPDPFEAGAHVVTLGTHKVMGGPIGGLILTGDPELAARFQTIAYPGFTQTRDVSKYAAAAFALAELLAYAPAFSAQVLRNVGALAAGLETEGFDVVGKRRGYSRTHQLLVNAHQQAAPLARRCQAANILVAKTNLHGEPYGSPEGRALRASIAQVTRQGMGEDEMREIATLIAGVALERVSIDEGRRAVDALVRRFPDIGYSHDDA